MYNFFTRNYCACIRRKRASFNNLIEWNDTVPWKSPITGGTVIKVYDGDTITVAERLPYNESPLYRWSIRLAGIDTPEIKSVSPELARLAITARDELSNKIMGKRVVLKNIKTEKYGRVLATVVYEDQDINQWLLDQNYAYEYDGKKKLTEEEQLFKLKYSVSNNKI